MDLSGIIFAGLAVAWAVYLIPKALRQHDEMARSRSVDRFSHTMRVLGRKESPAAAHPDASPSEGREASTRGRMRHTVTRPAARRAASRRRRVLALLLLVVAAVAVLAWRLMVPYWAVAIPVGLVVVFLVIARLTVRRERVSMVAAETQAGEETGVAEDTVEVSRDELAATVASPPVDAGGSLWDPLPLTVPTYVNKASARRTIRTIELTQASGVTSSGHDAEDSALVAAAAEADKPVDETEQRTVAGA